MGMKPMSPYQIILADDHLMFRNGLKRIIEDAQNLLVMGEAIMGLIKDSAVDLTLFKPFDLEVIIQILQETRTQPEQKLLSALC